VAQEVPVTARTRALKSLSAQEKGKVRARPLLDPSRSETVAESKQFELAALRIVYKG
jgi:hypothetical protein